MLGFVMPGRMFAHHNQPASGRLHTSVVFRENGSSYTSSDPDKPNATPVLRTHAKLIVRVMVLGPTVIQP